MFLQVHDPNYIVSDVFEKCQEPENQSPGFCLTKPTLVKKIKKGPAAEKSMNDTGNQFFSSANAAKAGAAANDTRTLDIQKSSIKILKQLMQHKRAKNPN